MSAETIDLKINSARTKTESIYKGEHTWQDDIYSLLDRMNELNEILGKLQSLLLGLTFELERDSEGFKKSQNAPEGIKSVTTNISKILILIRKSDLYPGVKTIYGTIKAENNYLKELLHDRDISIQLDSDIEMQEVISATLSAAKK